MRPSGTLLYGRLEKLRQAELVRSVKPRQGSSSLLVLTDVAPATWLRSDPEVPGLKWFKDFSSFPICGEDEFINTFLPKGRLAEGKEMF
jgi:hypothetical protein